MYTYVLKDLLDEKKISNILSITTHPGLAATNLQVTSAKTGGMDLNAPFMSHAQSEDGASASSGPVSIRRQSQEISLAPNGLVSQKSSSEKDLLTDANPCYSMEPN